MSDNNDLTRELEIEFEAVDSLPIGSNVVVENADDSAEPSDVDAFEPVNQIISEETEDTSDTVIKENGLNDENHTMTDHTSRPGFFATVKSRIGKRDRLIAENADFLVALLPLIVWGVYAYGTRVIAIVLTGIASAIIADIIGIAAFRRKIEFPASSAAVTGILIALSCSASVPLWMVAAASAFAIIVVDNLLNGRGIVPLNPVATVVALLYAFFPSFMMQVPSFGSRVGFSGGEYALESASDLSILLGGKFPEKSLYAMLFGIRSGGIGHISAILITCSFIYLLIRKAVRSDVAAGFFVTLAVYFYLRPKLAIVSDVLALQYSAYQLLSADTLFSVIFIASSPLSCPKTSRGRLIAGVAGGLTVALSREYLGGEISVVIAVLVINLLSRPLDLLFQPMGVFGGKYKKPKKVETENET